MRKYLLSFKCEHAPVTGVRFACIYVNVCKGFQERATVMSLLRKLFFLKTSSVYFRKATVLQLGLQQGFWF